MIMNIFTPIISLIKKLKILLFNFKESIYHRSTDIDAELLRNTQLFNAMSPEVFQKMLRCVKYVKYPQGKLIFREGERGDSLDVIASGSVRVFTYDMHQHLIPLARLNKGDYFGEQALLGQAYKTRNANIEAIVDTTLLQIDSKFITHLFQADPALKSKLKKSGYQQLLNILSLSTGFYSDIKLLISQIEKPNVKEYSAGDLLFAAGDQSNDVYIILEGEVQLRIPDPARNDITTIVLHRGHIFGELGVMQNKSRAATAIAHSNVRLLCIDGNDFKDYISWFPQLQNLLTKFQQLYQIPTRGAVEQYVGAVEDMGSTITNVYKIEDGRSIISSKFLKKDIFTMSTVGAMGDKFYHYKKGHDQLELEVLDNQLIGIKAIGFWSDLPKLAKLILDRDNIKAETLARFEKTGVLQLSQETEGAEFLCECMMITRDELQKLIDDGARDFETLMRLTGVNSICDGCRYKIMEMLGETPWLSATMRRVAEHTGNVRSYLLKPINSRFKSAQAGQHVIIQVKIGNNWVERPYAISGTQNGGLRITIKKEPKGLLAQWLFEHAPEEFNINASQPRGNFLLSTSEQSQALCFASGIGITPFVMYLQSLLAIGSCKKIHVIYSAASEEDFILKDELNRIQAKMPSVTVSYHDVAKNGSLSEADIINEIKKYHDPDIYICGPESFEHMICHALKEVNYDTKKVRGEQFVHAGVVPPAISPRARMNDLDLKV